MEDETKMNLEKYKMTLDFLKFEATTLWQIFSTFLVVHTILIGFISTLFIIGKNQYPALLFISGLIGFLLTILWLGTCYRNSKWYFFRMSQAKKAEKILIKDSDDWFLLNKEAENFNKGISNEIACYILITIFLFIYASILLWSFCCFLSFSC